MFEKLFSPITIKGLELKNRIILPAMGTKFAGKERMVNDQLIKYHVERVKAGCALNMVEVASVHQPSAPRNFVAICNDQYIPGLKKLTDAIHSEGGKAGIQLWQGSLAVSMDQTALILLASDMPFGPGITMPGMTIEQIHEVVDCYGQAARRAVEAGFDCVEVHVAHNYLPHSFLSPGINHRTDEYGGSFENRSRFPLEVIRAVKANVPGSLPVFMRIDAHDDYLEGGLTIENVIAFCKLAKEAGIDVLDISRGNIISAALQYEVPPIDLPRAFNIDNAAKIRKETGMITMGVGRVNTPQLAEEILAADKVDLIGIGRAQLADPDFCRKAKEGNTEDIDYCVGCNQGCYDGFESPDSPHITCLRNPAVGRELTCKIVKAEQAETVLIAGGGIAGLEAAIVLKQRGHKPILCETTDTLGGQFLLAGEAPRKGEMREAVQSMAAKAERLGVEIRLNTSVTKDLIDSLKPHTVINAIGAVPLMPRFPGIDLPFVYNSHDVLAGKKSPSGSVVVIGGGMVGMEIAEYLAEKGCQVTDLEMLPDYCQDMGSTRKICIAENIHRAGIISVTGVTVTEIKDGVVVASKDGETVTYPCDSAVIAIGAKSRPSKDLEEACLAAGCAYFSVGDAAMARKAINATKEAYDVALTFDDPAIHAEALKPKKVVFVTGGTGTMGKQTLEQLLERSNRFLVRAIARPSEKNKALMKKLACPSLEVIWGEMSDYDTILKCVTGADYVLHIGAMVSPMADVHPKETLYTNIGSTLNIIKAIKSQPDPDKVHFAYVGTVAMTGGRAEPIQWGRVGDPINPSIFDYYALSKVFSEMALYDSGLKYWVSIRQTGQHPGNEEAGNYPILYHQNPNNVLEWSTAIESGICMANLCEEWVPESFWRKAYNLSSGAGHRLSSWEMMDMQLGAFDIHYKDLFDSRMLALYNFHGHYYTDSDALDDILHFRCIPPKQYWDGVKEEMALMAANPMIRSQFPTAAQMNENYKKLGHQEMGGYWMFESNEEDWIHAFFGSREKQAAIKSYEDGYVLYHPSEDNPTYLDHGYDESRGLFNLTLEDLQKAAAFRGGECLATEITDIYTPIKWKCADGHEFMLSINAVLQGGHWCPECLKSQWHYGLIAKKNPFYAQVWTPIHGDDDTYQITMKHSAYDIANELKEKLGL